MAKRTGFTATTEHRSARATSSRTSARPAAGKSDKKRPAPRVPLRSKHAPKAAPPPRSATRRPEPAAAPDVASASASGAARAGSSRDARQPSSHGDPILLLDLPTRATPPPRIPTPPPLAPRSMELEWSEDPGVSPPPPKEPAFDRWVRRGDELLRNLALHGAADHEYRVDLKEGRFYWIDPRGRVSAEARAELVCTFVPQTSSVTMGWADLRLRGSAIARIAGMPSEIDDLDEEGAWRVAMHTADRTAAQYLYRVRSPARCLFLALSRLTFAPSRPAFVPTTPVALVLATLGETRAAANLGAEPVDTLRARLSAAGAALLEQAEYAHRDTDWVARLVRTGRRLVALAERLPRPTFFSVAKGASTLWLEPKLAVDLVESIGLLEEEWRQFA